MPHDMGEFQSQKIIYAENWMRAIGGVLNKSLHRVTVEKLIEKIKPIKKLWKADSVIQN